MSDSRLRVLVVGHTYVVGVNQSKLVALAEGGVAEVGLLVPDGWWIPDWNRRLPLDPPASRIKTFSCRVPFEGRGGAYVYPPWVVARALRSFRPHLLHVEQEVFSLSTFELAVASRLANVPLSVFCWENVDRPLSVVRRKTRQFVLQTAALIVAGNAGAAELVHSWGYRGPTTILPQLGVDTRVFKPALRSDPASPLTIGFVGRLVYEKGVDLLLDAARQLCTRGCAPRLVVCGDGPGRQDLMALAKSLHLDERVEWIGAVSPAQVPRIMANLDVLVLPSRSAVRWKEQFGHVLIEAMAMGIPVVGSSCGEIPNVIGRSDLVFPEGDATALAGILERLMREPAWRTAVAEYGRRRVHEHYTQERIAERLIEAWQRILAGPGKVAIRGD